ncbi:MAG: metallophosphoesterase [Nitrosopumilus sp.]|nr:metallophosphoesterase [Nitrosopumilus sp.]MDH3490192.1 metallophosphoesterase [Nitrosopumilus sp.]MDH3516931.1 metallophosphoesterase [Nitrosopumilus sp.]MDH3565306.1 metallophosphoesterase [Nitrosopumilus sp.]MDH5416638.1 metallophosphoesterase [Nitrosopumilus sp.]
MPQIRILPARPALIIEGKKKNLVITDLHIGFENSMTSNKIFVGKNSTINETIQELSKMIESEKPDSVILLGDIKSSIKSISRNEWDEIPKFFKEVKEKCDVILIPGNHDANIQRLVPDNISMISSAGMVEDNMLLTHGHTMPSENFSHVDKIIMGHIHPVFFQEDSIMNGQRVWVSIKTEKEKIFPNRSGEIEITIIPSFNRYFYATHRKQYKKSISPIIDKIKPVLSARIVTLDGVIIGNESIIDQVI